MKSQCIVCEKKDLRTLFRHHNNWKVVRCRSCGLVQVAPMPSSQEVASLYHEDFDHFQPYIEQLPVHRAYFRKKIREMRSRMANRESRIALLDIGCAMGVLLEEAQRVGWRAIGVDMSRDAVSYCRKKGLTVYPGTVQSADSLARGSFDVVTAFEVIEHERDPLSMIKRIHGLLKNGGIVVLTTPNHSGFWRRLMGKWWLGYQHPEHLLFFDHKSMRYLLEKAGFRDIEVRSDSPRPFPLSFTFTRAADYFPFFSFILRPIGELTKILKVKTPFHPFDSMLAIARK